MKAYVFLSVLFFSSSLLAQNVDILPKNDPNSQRVYDQGGESKIQRLNMTETGLNDVKQRLSSLQNEVNQLKAEMAELKRKMNSSVQVNGVR